MPAPTKEFCCWGKVGLVLGRWDYTSNLLFSVAVCARLLLLAVVWWGCTGLKPAHRVPARLVWLQLRQRGLPTPSLICVAEKHLIFCNINCPVVVFM